MGPFQLHPKLRLLCIDDEDIGLRVRKAVFELAGYDVSTAQNAESAIELFKTGDFHAVVLDFLMPGKNGGEIAAALRGIRPEVPILLLSAYVNLPEDVTRLVDAQVLKGARPEALLHQVQTMIENRRLTPHDQDGK